MTGEHSNAPTPLATDERVAFETWAESQAYDIERRPAPGAHTDDRNGRYRGVLTRAAWEAWEARAADWRRVADVLPVEGVAVLCYWPALVADGKDSVDIAARTELVWHHRDDDEDEFSDPTHWMPLPEAPV